METVSSSKKALSDALKQSRELRVKIKELRAQVSRLVREDSIKSLDS